MSFTLQHPKATAVFSPCRTWRYVLTRTWDTSLPSIAFLGVNPSIADEHKLDNTTKKCRKWSARDGYGTYVMLNLFGLVSTNPKGLRSHNDPNGPENDDWIRKTLSEVKAVVFAWGATANNLTGPRIEFVEQVARELGHKPLCLGVTKGGFPLHPCRLANATKLVPYRG